MDIQMKTIAGNTYLNKLDDQILVDSVSIKDVLKLSDTPFMIFLENRIRENIRNFCTSFKSIFSNFEGYYSFKANYLPEICRIVQNEGIGTELVGLPELNLALALGFPSNKILVGGPYLPNNLIDKSVSEDIREIIVYNLNDLNRINAIARKYDKVQNICLRIKSTKFASNLGVSSNANTINILKNFLKKSKNVKLTTILSHYSTQMNNVVQYRENVMNIVNFYEVLKKNGIDIENINLGGGFPEASIMHKERLEKIAQEINSILNQYNINYKSIYFEPGRYFIGDSGLFVTQILKKTTERWIFLNIGSHICPKFAKCSLRFYNGSRINDPHKFKTSIAGIIPTDQDVLVKDYFFTKELKEGDIVMVVNVGAYCLTFSNRFPYSLPNIFLIKGENIQKIFDQDIQGDFFIKSSKT
jgi:diaminopimelate decarboxylase